MTFISTVQTGPREVPDHTQPGRGTVTRSCACRDDTHQLRSVTTRRASRRLTVALRQILGKQPMNSESVASDQTDEGRPEIGPNASMPVDDSTQSKSASDRRVFPRRNSGCVVSVRPVSSDEVVDSQQMAWMLHSCQLKGELCDISMSGAAVVLPQPVAQQSAVLMRLRNPRFDRQIDVAATVVRCFEDSDGHWKITCQFKHKLSLEQIQSFGHLLNNPEFV